MNDFIVLTENLISPQLLLLWGHFLGFSSLLKKTNKMLQSACYKLTLCLKLEVLSNY